MSDIARHLWPETSDPNAPSERLFVNAQGAIGIDIGGHVIVMPMQEWHFIAREYMSMHDSEDDDASAYTDGPDDENP